MVGTIIIIVWLGLISISTVIGIYKIISKLNKITNKKYKYYINIEKIGIKNKYKQKYPIIKTKLKGEDAYFLLDTGSTGNILYKEKYKTFGKPTDSVKIVGETSVTGLGGGDTCRVIEESFNIGKNKFTEEFIASDAIKENIQIIKTCTNLDILGILGAEFFEKARWIIDIDDLVVKVKN